MTAEEAAVKEAVTAAVESATTTTAETAEALGWRLWPLVRRQTTQQQADVSCSEERPGAEKRSGREASAPRAERVRARLLAKL